MQTGVGRGLPEKSKVLRDTGLLQHAIRGVSREDFLIHREAPLCDRAEPDLMISPARPLEITSLCAKKLLRLGRVTDH